VETAEQGITTLVAKVAQVAGLTDEPARPDAGWAGNLAQLAAASSAACAGQVRADRTELDQAQDRQREPSGWRTGSAGALTRCEPGISSPWPPPVSRRSAVTWTPPSGPPRSPPP